MQALLIMLIWILFLTLYWINSILKRNSSNSETQKIKESNKALEGL